MAQLQSALKWEEPPPRREKRYDWNKIAARLRKHPNEWAKVYDDDLTSLATAIRIKGIKALHPDKGFEVRTANNTRGHPRRCTLYLRYVPGKDSEAA